MIFINVELSRQVLVLLLARNQHAWERVRKRRRDRERCEDVKRREREDETVGVGQIFGRGCHTAICQLPSFSCAT